MKDFEGTVAVDGRVLHWSTHFQEDLGRAYREQLRKRDYHPRPDLSGAELGRLYHKWRERRLEHLEGRKMRVRYSNEMREQQRYLAIRDITNRARHGRPLWPYTSKQTKSPQCKDDDLLNHWGIFHLHLGEQFENNGYINRTGPLLYACVSENLLLLIGVFGHHHDFSDSKILNIAIRNWPDQFADYKLRGVAVQGTPPSPVLVRHGKLPHGGRTLLLHPTQAVSAARTKELRDQGLCATFEAEDGSQYFAPGGGYMASGVGTLPIIRADYEDSWAGYLARIVKDHTAKLVASIPSERLARASALEFHVESLDDLKAGTIAEYQTQTRNNIQGIAEFDHDFNPAPLLRTLAAAAMAL